MWWTLSLLAHAGDAPVVHVDRSARVVYVLDEKGEVVHQEPAGVGRGGLKDKTTMSDRVTPLGTFKVDLILARDARHNAITPAHQARWGDHPTFGELVQEPGKLYVNMSLLDFDGDGVSDGAYGEAYVGLHSDTAVTGPKMRIYQGTPYWYSIALHGTPDPANLGAANSGGCVHLSGELLGRLLDDGTLKLGRTVVIADGPPVPR